jgi:2,4-dienoyl-CoA reductase-like NADH-dependent reductase (Old Yellow Enzyme family)
MNDRLFQPFSFGDKKAPNRLVAQAMEINSASDRGAAGRRVIERYEKLARGRWGIVFSEAVSITRDHLARDKCLILSPDTLDSFKRLVDAVKAIDPDTLFLFQLTHSGRQSGDFSKKVKVYEDDETGIPVLTTQALDHTQALFIEAAALARDAGADGVDIKSCHGYLGGELLRPLNRRNDRYGGSAENRAFLASSVIRSVSSAFPGFITGSRISLFEGIRGGCGTGGPDEVIENLTDMQAVLTHFVNAGAAYLNVSGGIPPKTPDITRPTKKGQFYRFHQFRYAQQVKQFFPGTAVIGSAYTTGDLDAIRYAEENLEKGNTDFAGFGRQNLADPLFPEKLKKGRVPIDFCELCGGCSGLLRKNKNVYCIKHGKAPTP